MPKKFSSKQERRTYQTWADMKSRCYNPKYKRYTQYGGDGIEVCKRWHTFALFVKDMGLKPDGMVLGRKDKHLGYTPNNCLWMSYAVNNLNKKESTRLTFRGVTQSIAMWADELGMPRTTLSNRIHIFKWDTKTALTAPWGHRENVPDDPEKAKFLPKLNQAAAELIRIHSNDGSSRAVLAERFGVSRSTIGRVIRGEVY